MSIAEASKFRWAPWRRFTNRITSRGFSCTKDDKSSKQVRQKRKLPPVSLQPLLIVSLPAVTSASRRHNFISIDPTTYTAHLHAGAKIVRSIAVGYAQRPE